MACCDKFAPIHPCPITRFSYYIRYLAELRSEFFFIICKPCPALNNPRCACLVKRFKSFFFAPCGNKGAVPCYIFRTERHPVVKVCLNLKEFFIFIIKAVKQIIDIWASYKNYLYVHRYWLRL